MLLQINEILQEKGDTKQSFPFTVSPPEQIPAFTSKWLFFYATPDMQGFPVAPRGCCGASS